MGQSPPDLDDDWVNLKDFAVASRWLQESEYKGNQTQTSYGPLTCEVGQTYWWRVSSDDVSTVTKGPVWSLRLKK